MTQDDPKAVFKQFLVCLGADPEGDLDLDETARLYTDLLSRYFAPRPEPELHLMPFSRPTPVALRSLPFYSLCQHHLVPFFGTMDVAYIPTDKVVGFGGVERCIAYFSSRPQIQERLTEQVAQFLFERIGPSGLLVVSRARQLCLELNGRSPGAEIVAVARRGEAIDRDYWALLGHPR